LYQVVVFKDPQTLDVSLTLVHDIWRGAAMRVQAKIDDDDDAACNKKTQKLPPRMRVSKPVTHELDVQYTARVKLIPLERLTATEYACCCLSQAWVVDPMVVNKSSRAGFMMEIKVISSSVVMKQCPGLQGIDCICSMQS
jgi:hypothetical protein